jgi:hypothetical protein
MTTAIAWALVLVAGVAIGLTVPTKGRAFDVLLYLGLALVALGVAFGPSFNRSPHGTEQFLLLNPEAGPITQLMAVAYASLLASLVVSVRRFSQRKGP